LVNVGFNFLIPAPILVYATTMSYAQVGFMQLDFRICWAWVVINVVAIIATLTAIPLLLFTLLVLVLGGMGSGSFLAFAPILVPVLEVVIVLGLLLYLLERRILQRSITALRQKVLLNLLLSLPALVLFSFVDALVPFGMSLALVAVVGVLVGRRTSRWFSRW
jgi:uncharacterized membrane protein